MPMDVLCPFCGNKQKQLPVKTWPYGKLIQKVVSGKTTVMGSHITCSRYQCKCGKFFNFYQTKNNKSWTNPKPRE